MDRKQLGETLKKQQQNIIKYATWNVREIANKI
jgi:hypothetical protein